MCIIIYFSIIILFLVSENSKTEGFRVFTENGNETILALENEMINIECRSDLPVAYCVILHPSGKRYSFSGLDPNVEKCSIKIKAQKNDSGQWRCNIGNQFAGVEIMKIMNVKIVNEVAAVVTNITATHRKPKTLYCTTTKGFIPLSYCRFEPPNALPFSIDESVTEDQPLLKKYYYPANKSLDRGDCAVTIRKVKYEDVGVWTCGAGLSDGKEYIDVINLNVEGFYTMSTASVTGITFGTIGLIGLLTLLGFVAWKKRNILGSLMPDATVEAHELERVAGRDPPSQHLTPQPGRSLPLVTIESPSEQSEPGTMSPLMSPEED